MKKSFKQTINEITSLSSNLPKSVNEALYTEVAPMGSSEEYNPSEEEMANNQPMPQSMPQDMEEEPAPAPQEENIPQGESEVNTPEGHMAPEELINDIRKKALVAMADLADTPEDPNYDCLKKIWSFCDKAVSEKQDERQVMAKNPNMK